MAFRAFLVQLRTVFPISLPPLQEGQNLTQQLLQAVLPVALCVLGLTALQRRHAHAWVIGLSSRSSAPAIHSGWAGTKCR
jgi:hypothetical protein